MNTKIRAAAGSGNAEGLKAWLVHPDCDLMSKNSKGMTALMLAARNGHLACVLLLIPQSNPWQVDSRHMTALMWAVSRSHIGCVKILLPLSERSARCINERAAVYAMSHGYDEREGFMDAYTHAASEMVALSDVTVPGKASKSSSLRL